MSTAAPNVISSPRLRNVDEAEWALRVDLAAAFRLSHRFGWSESVANHFSAMVPDQGDGEAGEGAPQRFLMNPRWRHWARIKASDLMLLDLNDHSVMEREGAPDPSAWCIHGNIHRQVPQAKVLLHLHPPYTTALSGLKDPTLKPIEQVTARFFNRVAVDMDFGGIGDNEEEGQRLAALFGDKRIMMMGNHGLSVAGPTVAEAFEDLYMYERASQFMVNAYATGQPLNVLSDEIAEKTAAGWEKYRGGSYAHFGQLKEMLDEEEPSYKE